MHVLAWVCFSIWCLVALLLTVAVVLTAAEPRNRRAHNLGRRLAWGSSIRRLE